MEDSLSLTFEPNSVLPNEAPKLTHHSFGKSSSTSEYTVLNDGVNLPIALFPQHPKQGIEAALNYPYYHMSLEASGQTNDTTK